MHSHASTIASLLDADLGASGWDKELLPTVPRDYAKYALAKAFTKKFTNGENPPEADAAALRLFLTSNELCKGYVFNEPDNPDVSACVANLKDWLMHVFFFRGPDVIPSMHSIGRAFAVGPGASVGSKGDDFYSKLAASKLSSTNSTLHLLYKQSISSHPVWSAVEELRTQALGDEIVSGSRLSFAAKTAEISRVICTEPLLNMMFQKGIAQVLEDRLRELCGIDFRRPDDVHELGFNEVSENNQMTQPEKNAALACHGSVDGSFATIDLKSASDMISLTLLRQVLPAHVLHWLERTRSRSTTLPSGEQLELHMMSSMGNGFTFALQTILFTAVVLAVYKHLGIKPYYPYGRSIGNFGVFGDDLVVRREAFDLVVLTLEALGSIVNKDKSFNTGQFRESCGHDYYRGYDVRGVYIKNLRDANDFYSAINRLNRWSARHGVPVTNTVRWLLKQVPFLPVPADEADDSGVKVPHVHATRKTRTLGPGLYQYRVSALAVRSAKIDADLDSEQSFSELRRKVLRNRRRDFDSLEAAKSYPSSPLGLLLAVLAGHVRKGRISFRANTRRPTLRRRVTPRWDYLPCGRAEMSGYQSRWVAWLDYVLSNEE
jgi:hypothetical protein